ncbi:hypothetical protein AV654_30350 [Paenibacillus elgii]|uniref:Uncharacterized protein n=1 Tax=Paenibacillus elgii TaxID=189691 RepID=A0A165QAR0_9BACL|nr:restriction endonuclease [Paenibacillus elgii]KZE74274.1 hypothetical protein AV654_30350 [Paenibacillus elgii]
MDNTISYKKFINKAPDHEVWKPFSESEKITFLKLIQDAREALQNGTRQSKGSALEKLMTFVYKQFDDIAYIHENITHGDNQIDHMIEFVDGLTPTFIHEHLGIRIIGESKNQNKTIGVRDVADLSELLRSKQAKMGIFSSFKPFSRKANSLWQYAEGKRRKLALANNVLIIGFTLDEIEALTDENFYSLLKKKCSCLIDELGDDLSEFISDKHDVEYQDRMFCALKQLHMNGIITNDSFEEGIKKINEKYGEIKHEY